MGTRLNTCEFRQICESNSESRSGVCLADPFQVLRVWPADVVLLVKPLLSEGGLDVPDPSSASVVLLLWRLPCHACEILDAEAAASEGGLHGRVYGEWYVANVSIIFDAPCLFYTNCYIFCPHFMTLLWFIWTNLLIVAKVHNILVLHFDV
jgi:hypothetical protein